jgi:tether containing UBX domain for GLUT4
VQSSRSATVVSIALQLPDNRRFTNKLPSTTSLWQTLRQFETTEELNITERAVPPTTNNGAGRLFYEMPVVSYLQREFSTLEDLQKSLSQIGIAGGSVLLRLSFRDSQKPLEEAMQNISQFFKTRPSESTTEIPSEDKTSKETQPTEQPTTSIPALEAPLEEINIEPDLSPPSTEPTAQAVAPPLNENTTLSQPAETATQSPAQSSVTVYTPTTTNTPLAATQPFNEKDYIPTIEHAKTHQSRLLSASRNKRLPSDAELASASAAKSATLSSVTTLTVRVRLPDTAILQTTLTRPSATPAALYAIVRLNLRVPSAPFILRYVDARGAHVPLRDDPETDLISGLNWRGNVMVHMLWGDGVAADVRGGPVLKAEALQDAQSVSTVVPDAVKEEPQEEGTWGGFLERVVEKGKKLSSPEKEAKLKSLFGLGKKK